MAQSDTVAPPAPPAPPSAGHSDGEMLARDTFADGAKPAVDMLVESLDAMRIQAKLTVAVTVAAPKLQATRLSDASISPADFVNLQSMRSSALACKTNTTSKFNRDCRNLFADLLAPTAVRKEQETATKAEDKKNAKKPEKNDQKKMEKNEKLSSLKAADDKKSDTDEPTEGPSDESKTDENKEDELLSRGPVRTSRVSHRFHPNGESASDAVYSTAAQSAVYDLTSFSVDAYNYGYDCGATQFVYGNGQAPFQPPAVYDSEGFYDGASGSRESTPDTILSVDLDYGGGYNPMWHPGADYGSASVPQYTNSSAYGQSTNYSSVEPSKTRPAVNDPDDSKQELPDALSDFILQYSRRYTSERSAGASPASAAFSSDFSSAEASPLNYYGNDFDLFSAPSSNSNQSSQLGTTSSGMPASVRNGGSACASPLSAAGAPKCSPAQPHGCAYGDALALATGSSRVGGSLSGARPAKDRLRALINNNDMDEAWAWTCKCIQNYPSALCYRDADRDTLLHIVTLHADHAKIYALVEQMLKMESEFSGGDLAAAARRKKPFDMANRAGETPLFLAVKKRDAAVVDYLLEAGAQPNVRSLCADQDTPLHYAAGRGMTRIVEILCAYPHTDVNLANGAGVTPLLHAVRRHGAVDDEDASVSAPINSALVIRALLRHGADPNIVDSANGKTIFHYAAERRSEKLITLLHAEIGDAIACQLAERADHSGETPAGRLAREEHVRLRRALAACSQRTTPTTPATAAVA